jgi:hypothetical protein
MCGSWLEDGGAPGKGMAATKSRERPLANSQQGHRDLSPSTTKTVILSLNNMSLQEELSVRALGGNS